MDGSGRVVSGQYGPDQNSFHEVLRRHQNMEAVAAVLDASFKNLSESGYTLLHLRHASHVYLMHTQQPLTVRDNMISWKFLFPAILFFRALTESLGLQKKKKDKHIRTRRKRRRQSVPVGNLPLFCLIDDVTDLHVERPILWLQGAAGRPLC